MSLEKGRRIAFFGYPMIDDNNDFRNNFVAQFALTFKRAGWLAQFHKDESYWSFTRSLDQVDVRTSLSQRNVLSLPSNTRVVFSAGFSEPELDRIFYRIAPPVKGDDAQPLVLKGLRIQEDVPATKERQDALISGISQKLITWAGEEDAQLCIQDYAKPWLTERQTPHLAALAYVGDFNTLMDYQDMFKRGKRANFYPYITQEMLDRATDIALARA